MRRPGFTRSGFTRRGFTLAEVVLASIIGGVVTLACVGLFTAVSRADQAFASRAREMTEMASTQRTLRRAMLGLVMMPASQRPDPAEVQQAIENGETPPSPDEWPLGRFIIEADPSPALDAMASAAALDGVMLRSPAAFAGLEAQRVEVVVGRAPVPPGLAFAGQSWARVAYANAVVDQSEGLAQTGEAQDPGLRGVFDLRPDGFRERVIAGLGPIAASQVSPGFGIDDTGRRFAPSLLSRPAVGWTLWWRPVYPPERDARDAGQVFDVDEFPELLLEAVPLVRGLESCRFTAFALDEQTGEGVRFDDFVAHASRDLPGYVEVELRTVNGMYANWMFEVGWQVADEGVTSEPVDADGDGIADDADEGAIPDAAAEINQGIRDAAAGLGGGP